jgi:hypothetical protein
MTRITVLIASAAINASTIPTVAPECTSSKDDVASRTCWATLRIQPIVAANDDKTSRAYAGSFDRSAMQRLAAVTCVDSEPTLAERDIEINASHNLLAMKCGS